MRTAVVFSVVALAAALAAAPLADTQSKSAPPAAPAPPTAPSAPKAPERSAERTPPPSAAAKALFSPYMLTVCAQCGKPLGDSPVVFTMDNGREIRCCSATCQTAFKANPEKALKTVDEAMVKEQLKFYPAMNCVVMKDDELSDPRGPKAMDDKNVIVGNRLVRFCCSKCARKMEANPQSYLESLNQSIIEMQGKNYPVTTCLVSGKPLGASPRQVIVGSRLVRLCCPECEGALAKDPAKFLAKLDAAAKDAGSKKDAKDPIKKDGKDGSKSEVGAESR